MRVLHWFVGCPDECLVVVRVVRSLCFVIMRCSDCRRKHFAEFVPEEGVGVP